MITKIEYLSASHANKSEVVKVGGVWAALRWRWVDVKGDGHHSWVECAAVVCRKLAHAQGEARRWCDE